MGVVSDAFPLLRKVDGVIAVTRIGMCTRDTAAHLREQLARLEAPVLGIVANAVKLGWSCRLVRRRARLFSQSRHEIVALCAHSVGSKTLGSRRP